MKLLEGTEEKSFFSDMGSIQYRHINVFYLSAPPPPNISLLATSLVQRSFEYTGWLSSGGEAFEPRRLVLLGGDEAGLRHNANLPVAGSILARTSLPGRGHGTGHENHPQLSSGME